MDEYETEISEINRQIINALAQIKEKQYWVNAVSSEIFDLQIYVDELKERLYNIAHSNEYYAPVTQWLE